MSLNVLVIERDPVFASELRAALEARGCAIRVVDDGKAGLAQATVLPPDLILVAVAVPLCMILNTLRITLIGLVGNQYGSDAGHQFHDYSGYISLVICFVVLMKITKMLGWKS